MAETYQKGEYIRYACNGVCLVDDVRLDRLTKKEPPKEFYILKPVSNPASTLFVPTGNATLVAKMSRLPDREELDALILATREEPLDWIDDRKIRLASFQTIVKECDLGQLISLVSCIYHRREDLIAAGKKLGASDETIVADFVQSNTCRKEEIEALWAEHAEEIAARPEQKYFYLGISGVHPDDGPFVLQTIREQYGTTDAYLEAEYGLTPARLMRLRRMYLE